jgi:hypothetical protein
LSWTYLLVVELVEPDVIFPGVTFEELVFIVEPVSLSDVVGLRAIDPDVKVLAIKEAVARINTIANK